MKEIKELMGLGNGYEISKIDERIKNGKIIKQIYLFCTSKKVRCSKCNKFTSSIRDKLKPINLKYLKMFEYVTEILIIKRRFICHKCNYKFTEEVVLNNKNKSLSNKL